MFLGVVIWRSPDRGFAFIRPDAPHAIEGAQDEIFKLSVNALKKCNAMALAKGDRVEFTVTASKSKPGKVEIETIKIIEQIAEARRDVRQAHRSRQAMD